MLYFEVEPAALKGCAFILYRWISKILNLKTDKVLTVVEKVKYFTRKENEVKLEIPTCIFVFYFKSTTLKEVFFVLQQSVGLTEGRSHKTSVEL